MRVFTDLAMEAREAAGEIKGVEFYKEQPIEGITLTRVKVVSEEGARDIGKPIGNYITIEAPQLRSGDPELREHVAQALAAEIKKMLPEGSGPVLVVGLGNWRITPDSLGPKAVEQTFVTRHMLQFIPDKVDKRIRPVCAMAPGVLGITGIESGEVVRGIVQSIQPKAVIAIDSLASMKTERLATSMQIADTGIAPGGGIGNKRPGLNRENLGIPVIAMGVPLVVYAAQIVADAIEAAVSGGAVGPQTLALDRVQRAAQDRMGDMVVTPKEIDELVEDASKMVADALNLALHEGMGLEEVRRYMD
ncbi:MAG: GPR endopeptidase [Bacillota bacterium]|nr:GPR endopeptidase [Bacillota bacterium]